MGRMSGAAVATAIASGSPHDRPCLLEPAPKLLERVLREVGATQLRHDAEPT
jgi:hypothetical protein